MKRIYEVRLTGNELGGYDAYVPSIDMTTCGDDLAGAVAMAYDLISTAVPAMLGEGATVPADSFDYDGPARVVGVMVDCDADTPALEWMTVQDASSLLGVSDSRVHAMIRSGILGSVKEGNQRLVSVRDVKGRLDNPQHAGRPAREAAMA